VICVKDKNERLFILVQNECVARRQDANRCFLLSPKALGFLRIGQKVSRSGVSDLARRQTASSTGSVRQASFRQPDIHPATRRVGPPGPVAQDPKPEEPEGQDQTGMDSLIAMFRRNPPAVAALAGAMASALTLLGAYYFEYVLKILPCPLCLQQRWAYYAAIPLATLVAWAAAAGWPDRLIKAGLVLLLLMFLANAGLGTYHAGAEWKLWAGPTDCAAPPLALPTEAGSLLTQMQQTVVVRCDEAAWRFLGLSLAGWNVLISLGFAGLMLAGLRGLPVLSAQTRLPQGSSSVSQ
jgi:disulfide bond formation protein DsbB